MEAEKRLLRCYLSRLPANETPMCGKLPSHGRPNIGVTGVAIRWRDGVDYGLFRVTRSTRNLLAGYPSILIVFRCLPHPSSNSNKLLCSACVARRRLQRWRSARPFRERAGVAGPTVDKLLGAVSKFGAHEGLFVSWSGFKPNVQKGLAASFFRVRLWTQKEMLEQLFSHYERLDEDIKAELPLKRIWTVAAQEEDGL